MCYMRDSEGKFRFIKRKYRNTVRTTHKMKILGHTCGNSSLCAYGIAIRRLRPRWRGTGRPKRLP